MSGCQLVRGVKHGAGHKVSHSNIKTNRAFKINAHPARFYSYALGLYVNINITNRTRRTIDKFGGFDVFLLSFPKRKLTDYAISMRKKIALRKSVLGDNYMNS